MSIRPSKVTYRRSFEKDLQKLPDRIKKDTEVAIQELLDGTVSPGRYLKKLKGKHSRFSMRLGKSYRLTFDLDENNLAIMRNVGSRENFYDD